MRLMELHRRAFATQLGSTARHPKLNAEIPNNSPATFTQTPRVCIVDADEGLRASSEGKGGYPSAL